MLLSLTACNKNEISKGFEAGYPRRGTFFLGIKSDINTFERDNIILDIYFGCTNEAKDYEITDEAEIQQIAILFINELNDLEINDSFEDIENAWVFKEFSYSDFITDEYRVNTIKGRFGSSLSYNHHETMVVPKDVFVNSNTPIYIALVALVYSQNDKYSIECLDNLRLAFDLLDNNKIKIS